MKQKTPPALVYEQTGKLEPIQYDFGHLVTTCRSACEQDLDHVILPVMEEQTTKKNKVRLVKEDKESPLGLVLKRDATALKKYYPYAAARFDVEELLKWAVKAFEDQIEEMHQHGEAEDS